MNVFKICSKVNAFRQSIDNQSIRLLRFFIRNEKVVGSSPTRGSNIASWESIKHKDWFPVSFLLIYIAVR